MLLVKSLLQWMQFAVLFQTLNGHDLPSIRLYRKHSTGFGGFAVYENGARSTARRIAAYVRSSQTQRIAYPMHKQRA
jgi:hypothetical protein